MSTKIRSLTAELHGVYRNRILREDDPFVIKYRLEQASAPAVVVERKPRKMDPTRKERLKVGELQRVIGLLERADKGLLAVESSPTAQKELRRVIKLTRDAARGAEKRVAARRPLA